MQINAERLRIRMNKVVLMGRLTRDPEVRYSQGDNAMAIARYTLAVNRRVSKDGEAAADFINCVAFSKNGEFAEKYFKKGMKVLITGHIQTGSYTDRDGKKIYTTDIVIEEQEFAESKNATNGANTVTDSNSTSGSSTPDYGNIDGFMTIPDGIEEELPFA